MRVERCLGRVRADIHAHNAYELIAVRRGRLLVSREQYGWTAGPGALVFFSNLEPHAVSVLEAPYERYLLTLSPQEAVAWIRDPVLASAFRVRPRDFCNVQHVPHAFGRIWALLEAMAGECERPDGHSEQALSSLLLLVLIAALRECPQAFPLNGRPAAPWLLEAQRYLDEHYAEPVSLSQLAGRLFISPGYLARQFRSQLGYSPQEYLARTRLAAARELLRQGDSTVAQVAAGVGFQDVSNFIKRYRARYGVTPKQQQLGRMPEQGGEENGAGV